MVLLVLDRERGAVCALCIYCPPRVARLPLRLWVTPCGDARDPDLRACALTDPSHEVNSSALSEVGAVEARLTPCQGNAPQRLEGVSELADGHHLRDRALPHLLRSLARELLVADPREALLDVGEL